MFDTCKCLITSKGVIAVPTYFTIDATVWRIRKRPDKTPLTKKRGETSYWYML